MKIDLICSLPHYFAHLEPIFQALPADLQGEVHPIRLPVEPPKARGRAALVAGWQDVKPLRGRCAMIYIEHGTGQGYSDQIHQQGYSSSGGLGHGPSVLGYIAPSATVAARWRNAPSIAVGCPKLDRWVGVQPTNRESICLAWHWPCIVSPECQTAWPHYEPMLDEIVDRFHAQGIEVFGHSHPRWEGELDDRMRSAGMTVLYTDAQVFERCGMLAVDNSSLAYEMAALGRPIVNLNAPWYRSDIEHGLRFWEFVPGIEVDGPEELARLNLWDVLDRDVGKFKREKAVQHAYAFVDGHASERAAGFIDSIIRDR